MLVAALSTGHKLGLGLTGLVFIVFALVSSFLLPRVRRDFPGRGLGVFLVVTFGLFFAMLAAVEIFGRESEEAKGGEEEHATGLRTHVVNVKEVDFKIQLEPSNVSAGRYTFKVHNDGQSPHNLAIEGPGVSAKSPTITPGKTTTLEAKLEQGTYDFYCAVPGHKQAGMDVKVTVS